MTGYPRCLRRGCKRRVEPQAVRRGRPKRFCSDACRQAYAHATAREMARHEWYSGPAVVEAARQVLGGIDLDPASSKKANEIVQATSFYTIRHDGLRQPWSGRLWLNPPYGTHAPKWVRRFAEAFPHDVPAAILLLAVHHMTTKWFAPLAALQPIACMPDHRLPFSGSVEHPMHGSVILGFGVEEGRFREAFRPFRGSIWRVT
jgi:hypothetical protein